ncbi:hypothetical protein GCM10020000_63640 [Streptomyces olivoverticillatus]
MASGTDISRAEAEAAPRPWRQAVVLGGGYAGLLTARVLAETFERVTVIERDRAPRPGEPRPGVPQARHPHGMLARGGQLLEILFPGLREELSARQAPVFDFGTAYRSLLPTGWAPSAHLDIPLQSCGRDTLEECLRRRVTALPQVETLDGFRADGLALDRAAGRVRAVIGRRLAPGATPENLTLPADLVVDATGRSSPLSRWLEAAGYPRARRLAVASPFAYSSRLYEIPDSARDHDWLCSVEVPFLPAVPRGGGILAIDGGRWIICLITRDDDLPPADDTGFLEYATGLRNPPLRRMRRRGHPALAHLPAHQSRQPLDALPQDARLARRPDRPRRRAVHPQPPLRARDDGRRRAGRPARHHARRARRRREARRARGPPVPAARRPAAAPALDVQHHRRPRRGPLPGALGRPPPRAPVSDRPARRPAGGPGRLPPLRPRPAHARRPRGPRPPLRPPERPASPRALMDRRN